MSRRIYLLVLLSALPAVTWADDHPNTSRGFAADKAFQVGDIDNVNLFNGNLTLTIPIGGSYPVGGSLSYGLTLVYNSNVWDFQEREDPWTGVTYQQGLPQRTQNAGLGWMLTLGRLLAPFTPVNETERWLYQGSDGAEHVFYPTLHVGDDDEPGDSGMLQVFSYTRDGSYLRLEAFTDGYREIEFPDGNIHRFDPSLRLRQMRDRFGNAVNVTYEALPPKVGSTLWKLEDTRGRTQRVYFKYVEQDNQPIEVVNWVELTAFNGTATYAFDYDSATIARACPHNDNIALGPNVDVPLLVGISMPHGLSYQDLEYVTNVTASDPLCRTSGNLRGLKLPTWGRLAWTYRHYVFPTAGRIHRQWSAGVATRKTLNAVGATLGTWSYDTSLTGTGGNQQLKNTVTDPLLHRTERYFLALGSHEYSLPFTHLTTDAGRYLSTQTFNAAGTLKRSTYVLYESDERPTGFQDHQELMNVNRRELSMHAVFEDDGDKYAEVTRSDFDGLGHYRVETMGGNFGAGDVRTTTVAFNPLRGRYRIDPVTNQPTPDHDFNMLPHVADWILQMFSSRKVEEPGATAFSKFCFDDLTGFLERQRTLKNVGTTEHVNDLLVVYTPTANGDLQTERYFGGDTQNITATNTTCTMSLPTAKYQIEHGYQGGVRATSQYLGGPLFLNQTIQVGSALPSRRLDVAGLATDYEYDSLGRPTWVKPVSDGYTEYVYTAPSSATTLADVLIRRRGNGTAATVLAQNQVFFDSLGRVWQEKQLLPSGVDWSVRETLYDAAGHKASVSELQTGTPNRTTRFLNYDPFGRATTIRPADGVGNDATHDVTLSYSGTRVVGRTVKIATSVGSETPVTTTETYDRQGRLWKVAEPSGPNHAAVTTTYAYDVGNRLRQVQTVAAAATQTRSFVYDNRGFLVSETHPEKGLSGNGTVSYSKYDARGHATRKVEGDNDLTFVYDSAERLTAIKTTDTSREIKSFSFAPANAGGNWRMGKLESATRYNYPFFPTLYPKVIVVETYTYGGRQGRISEKKTQLVWDDGPPSGPENRESFEQFYHYDPLGAVDDIDYPVCTFQKSCPSTVPRGVDFFYKNGRLTSVQPEGQPEGAAGGYATTISYHPNGLYKEIAHGNGAIDVQGNDPNSMPRPASLSAKLPGLEGNLWSSGTYSYDGAGNVASTGAGYFLYDRVSRVVKGHVFDGRAGGGTAREQGYTYDAFGNLTAISGDAIPIPPGRNVPVNPATNRLTGTSVLYDAAGNQTQGASPSGSCATGNPCYEYDALDMMTRMRNGGQEWRYVYTADDERFWSYRFAGGPGSLWTLRDLDGKVLRQYESHVSWTTVRDYVYRDGQMLASSHPLEGVRHFSLDHLGTPRLVTASAGVTHGIWTSPPSSPVPVPADYDGNGHADLSIFGQDIWHFYNDDGSYLKGLWIGGAGGDVPVPADYDGNGKDEPAIYRGGAWIFFDYVTGASHGVWLGQTGTPLPIDHDGDRRAELSVYAGGAWHFFHDNGAYDRGIWTGGVAGDVPVVGDFNGDGREEPAIFRGGAWIVFDYATGSSSGVWLGQTGTPVAMDYDGDGDTDMTVYSGGAWHAFKADGSYLQGLWTGGVAGDRPVGENFKGEGAEEPVIFRGGAWHFYHFGGMPVSYHAYFPFGDEITGIQQDAEPRKFTSHERDLGSPSNAADDLDYMHARHYNPLLGRFTSIDRHSGSPRVPQTWNRYSYALNSPVTFVDRDGMTAVPYVLVGAGAIGVLILAEHARMMQSDPSYRRAIEDLSAQANTYLFGKSKGGGRDSEFINDTIDKLLDKLEEAKAAKDTQRVLRILKELKNRGYRNPGKARGGRREPKKPPANASFVGGLVSSDESLESFTILTSSDLELLNSLDVPSLDSERAAACGVGVVSCPF